MDLGIRVRVWSRFTLNREGDGWSWQVWEAFTPGDIAQRPPPDQRSGGAEEEQLAGMNPNGAMLFLFCFSKVNDKERWWRRSRLLPSSPSLDQCRSRSSSTSGPSSFLYSCGPPTTKGARPRTSDARGARSPAAREYGDDGAEVERGERCRRCRERGRERRGKSETEWVTARWRWCWRVNPRVKEYSPEYAWFPLTALLSKLNAETVKIGSSDDFLRASEA
jgi:hypothetical protein